MELSIVREETADKHDREVESTLRKTGVSALFTATTTKAMLLPMTAKGI